MRNTILTMTIGWAALSGLGGCTDGGSGLANAVCGDQACNGDETCATCAGDCGQCNVAYCGDGACNGAEFCGTCSLDCGACPGDACGDGTCGGDETCLNCPGDCGYCDAAVCGDDTCALTESCSTCPLDCGSCGVLCGAQVCAPGLVCSAQTTCEAPCVPECSGKSCGDDGCGGSCGTCGAGTACDAAGQCVTTGPTCSCAGKACGDDGCGNSCGTCGAGTACNAAGQCVSTGPTCSCEGKACGDDGCGSSCGSCGAGTACNAAGQCVSTGPTCSCEGKACGDDGCGNSCGTCGAGTACNAAGQCVSTGPTCSCEGKSCGDDGCGNSCGSCGPNASCDASGQCVSTDPCQGVPTTGCCDVDDTVVWCDDEGVHELSCADYGGVCTWDGQSSFSCDLSTRATPSGTPTACPGTSTAGACDGRECGWNLGASCGTCPSGEACAQGTCTSDPCFGVTFEGCCFGDYALWCQDGELQVADCAGDGSSCGWTGSETFYFCDGSGSDPSGTWPIVCEIGEGDPSSGAMVYGDLVISEIMADPSKVDDSDGEWFEVANVSGKTFNLDGLSIAGTGTEGFTVAFDIIVGPGDRAVFTRWIEDENGGVQPDQVWAGSSLSLTNTSDTLRLLWEGTLIDEVSWSGSGGWTIPSGKSLTLRASKHDADANDAASAWCVSTTTYGDGDYGTPGAADLGCQ